MTRKFLPFALAVLIAPAVFGQDYAILIERPLKAGDELKISATAKQSQAQTVTLNGAPQKDQKQEVSIQFEGVEKVISVDANGKETKILLTIDKLTQTADGATKDLATKGTVVTCSVGADKAQVYEIDGKPADQGVGQALDMLVDLARGEPTDDEAFGTKERKKKGDSWDVNTEMTTKYLQGVGDFTNLAGKGTLDDVSGDTMKISAHITANFKPPLPPQITVDQATMDATINGTFPTDTSKYETEDSSSMTNSFTGHADTPNGKVVIKSTMEQSGSRTITPVK